MNKVAATLIFFCLIVSIQAQTITGKLIDQIGNSLSGLQLKLYISPESYSATSAADGSFAFNNITDVKSENELPAGYAVSDNYPNPFNPRTRIVITLPTSGNARVTVYNLLGKKVIDDIDKYFNAGNNFIDLELSGLPNGFYIARITLDNKYSITRKLMLVYGSQHLAISNIRTNFSIQKSILKTQAPLSAYMDSLVITGGSIRKNTFTYLGLYSGSNLNLGNLVINIQSAGTPCIGAPTVTDARDGKIYNTVQIGTQCWLRENLNIGTMIQETQDQKNNGEIEKYCYDNKIENCITYGGLYQWAEAMEYITTQGSQGICPAGWHIPTYTEVETLSTAVSNNGNALKAIGQGTVIGVGTNTSGFSALLGGYRDSGLYFNGLGSVAYFMKSSQSDAANAYNLTLYYYSNRVDHGNSRKIDGISVRCLKD